MIHFLINEWNCLKKDCVKNKGLVWNLLFEIAYSASLGARNSMGFGMVEVVVEG